jgi:hypothetical protein
MEVAASMRAGASMGVAACMGMAAICNDTVGMQTFETLRTVHICNQCLCHRMSFGIA